MNGQVLVNTPAQTPFPGGGLSQTQQEPPQNPLGLDSVKDEAQVDVAGVGWKEIVLTRDDFERLNFRLNRPDIPLDGERDDKKVFIFVFPILYFMLVFKDYIQIPEVVEGLLKVLLFMLAVFYIMSDNTLKRMRVDITSRLLIGLCFGGLLVVASTV